MPELPQVQAPLPQPAVQKQVPRLNLKELSKQPKAQKLLLELSQDHHSELVHKILSRTKKEIPELLRLKKQLDGMPHLRYRFIE